MIIEIKINLVYYICLFPEKLILHDLESRKTLSQGNTFSEM